MTDEHVEQARRFHAASDTQEDPSGWFDTLYAAAEAGRAVIPWDRGEPISVLTSWAERGGIAGTGRTAVVVGSGTGHDAEFVASLGFRTTAFDVSPTAVAAAERRFTGSSVSYVAADVFALPPEWRRSYDLVFECLTVQSVPPPTHGAATRSVRELVAPGGTLLVVASVQDNPAAAGPPWPLSRAEVDAFGTDGLDAVSVEETHDGRWHLWVAEFRRA